ncbi:hypothetical protein HAL1_08170 [Halomonas sp. HAL1]|nr:hypothetical protein HAL1_08170 [Halomonas sp. HAL1]
MRLKRAVNSYQNARLNEFYLHIRHISQIFAESYVKQR